MVIRKNRTFASCYSQTIKRRFIMAKNVPISRYILHILLAVCILPAFFTPCAYSQNDGSPNNTPLIEMHFVPSCLSVTDASAAQTSTTSVKGFYIAKHKVTRRLWNEIMGTNTDGEADDYLPMTNVSHDEVQLFIFWLNQKTKMHYRLPTETEWTCAVQAGLLPDVTPSFYLGGNNASTGFRLAMDYDFKPQSADTTTKAEQSSKPAKRTAADSAKVSIRALLVAEKAEAHQQKIAARKARLDSLPPTFFLTLNAAYTSMPQWSYGFKVGTVKLFGWYFSAMTNFHYRGAFSSFQSNGHYILTGVSKTTYLGGQLGLVVRPHQLLSLHIGAGFGYRALTFESDQGWHYYPRRSYYGPTASLGAMFHIKNVVISAEAISMVYNLNALNDARYAVGARVGVGVCLPIKN